MKLKILATSLLLCLLTSAAALAVEPQAAGLMPMGSVDAQQVGERPMLLAADSTYLEERAKRLHQPLKKDEHERVLQRQPREANPWWR